MNTVFTQAPFARFDLGNHILQGHRMGQGMEAPYLTLEEKNELLGRIMAAMKLVKPIEDLMAWSQDNDPGLKTYLGLDSTRYFTQSNAIAGLYPVVSEVGQRLQETDAEYWYRPSADELSKIKVWTTGINEMYKLIEKHKALPYTPAPGTKPPPTIVPAVTVSLSRGPSTKDILIGAGAAVGLGVILYAILG